MLDYFEVKVAMYGGDVQTLRIRDSNEAAACETARFHYNSDLRNCIISCKQIACGWEPERHHAFLD